MLHIATVHWIHDEWVDIQLEYLHRHIKTTFRVYAFLHGKAEAHREKYFYSNIEPVVVHELKLNLLAEIIGYHLEGPDDEIMFLDGDAFPIGDVYSFGLEKMQETPLIAIQRKENDGDPQPHPSFCMTTYRFWKEIHGDWKRGYQWQNARGELVTDVGANLLQILKNNNIPWHPLLRSNIYNIHPLWFGVYDNLIYHHGAGFRTPMSRADKGTPLEKRKNLEKNLQQSSDVFQRIKSDPEFYREFTLR
jgi:hypothetical protein